MPINKTKAVVLKRRDFRETSLIADFYTSDFGKMSGVLKGIRTEPGKFASTVEPFSLNEIIFYQKRNTALHLVSACDLKDNFSGIRANMYKVGIASMITELVDLIMPVEDANQEVFQMLLDALSELSVTSNPHKVITIFKIKILSLSGFRPHLDSCVLCQEKIAGQTKFSLNMGGLVCQKCLSRDLSARSIFKGTIATILHIQRNSFRQNLNLGLNPQIKKELDLILDSFLSFHLEKELRSQRTLYKIDNFVPAVQ